MHGPPLTRAEIAARLDARVQRYAALGLPLACAVQITARESDVADEVVRAAVERQQAHQLKEAAHAS